MKELITQEYTALIEELKSIMVEGVFNSRWVLLETYHQVGQLLSLNKDVEISRVARDSNLSVRTLERSLQFYEKYPDMDKLPNGKNISWHKVVNELLPEHKPVTSDDWITCSACGGTGKIKK